MTDIVNIPLNKLALWKDNVRKMCSKSGIEELAASIKAHGLQQNLVVRKDGRSFSVVAGGRRLKAMQLLVKSGDLGETFPVPCRIMDTDNATELSLAENFMREAMHPADQFAAFRDLADAGMPVADIAARFGCTGTHVQKLLRLARVSPKVMKAFKNGDLTLDCVMAFAVTDDHAAQERVLADYDPDRNEARDIRDALTEDAIAVTDKRVKLITLKRYEQAGGAVRRDLFSDDNGGIYIEDAALLDRLVAETLEKKAKSVKAEGWKWLLVMPEFGYQDGSAYRRTYPEPVPLTEREQEHLDALQAEYDALYENDDESEETSKRLDELDKLISALDDREGIWTPEQKAIAGAVVSIDYDGKVKVERGYVKPEDMPKQARKAKNANATDAPDATDTEQPPVGLSASLVESLTAQRSAALAAALLDKPDKALATIVYTLTLEVFDHCQATALELIAKPQSLDSAEGSLAFTRLEQARENWGQRIPGTPDDLWQWCLEQDQMVLLDLLAFCVARTVNAVQKKTDRAGCPRLEHARQLGMALDLDMKAWFTPTAENCFGRIRKPMILQALAEVRDQPSAPAWEKLKKSELAALAERELAGTGWLPEILR